MLTAPKPDAGPRHAGERQPTPEGQQIGYRLRIALREAGLGNTQVEIAKALKVSQMTVSYWSRGIKIPPIRTGILVARKTGIGAEWPYTGKGPKHPEPEDHDLRLARKLNEAPPRFHQFPNKLLEHGHGLE